MIIGERLKGILKNKAISAKEFALKVNVTEGMIYKYYKMSNIDSSLVYKWSEALDLPIMIFLDDNHYNKVILGEGRSCFDKIDDVEDGEDAIRQRESMVCENEIDYIKAKAKGIKLLPEVDFKFTGGQMELIGGSDTVKRYWHLPDCKDCEAIAQVAGNSMAPEYPSGCWVALKKVGFDVERSTEISFGNVFGIVLEDPITGDYHGHIKILRRYKDPTMARKYWIARSVDQDNYDDFDIDITKVRGLWIVKQHVVSDVFL